ncbi:hypothetical protein [Verrucomicrobium sp. BvORR106]|uniref:hypothetical protein n=1 Tax=Verrucomicrobium sp. BvORR106 TaxID=1403819 RepID=UPI002240EA28|nr:hypothetical protein [Verrucomicrobium sp. BvORR106]
MTMRTQRRQHQALLAGPLREALDRAKAEQLGMVSITRSFDVRRWDRGREAVAMLEDLQTKAPEREARFVNVGTARNMVRLVEIWALPPASSANSVHAA